MGLGRRLPPVLAVTGLLLLLTVSAAAASLQYTVVPGDSLHSLGQRFSVGVGDLVLENGLRSAEIRAGQVLRVPGLAYTVHPGDSLFLLARRFGTAVETLMRVNGLGSDRITVGQVLWIPGLTHTVQAGDSLFLLAQRYGTTVEALVSLNGLSSHQIRVGQLLRIPRLDAHSAGPGDSLTALARRFHTTVEALMRLNGLTSDRIEAGRLLAVPGGDVSGTAAAAAPAGPVRTAEELRLLAQMIHAEAGGEPYLGKVAVGAVVLNRIRSPHFPDTLRGVIFQPGQFCPIRIGSFWWTPGPESVRAARDAATGWDPSLGALYFYNPATATNRWIRTRPVTIRIGNHVFCR